MKTVFFDIDTQYDFMLPSGALSVPGAEVILPTVARLNQYACVHAIPLVSTVDAHAENDPEFRSWPPHCVAGTLGQHKPDELLLSGRVVIPNTAAAFTVGGSGQIVVEKQTVDVFATKTIGRVIEQLSAERYVVYGVVTEICVWNAVRGLLKAGGRVEIVTDGTKALSESAAWTALSELTAQGARLVTAAEILG